jgi:hypothetical protein
MYTHVRCYLFSHVFVELSAISLLCGLALHGFSSHKVYSMVCHNHHWYHIVIVLSIILTILTQRVSSASDSGSYNEDVNGLELVRTRVDPSSILAHHHHYYHNTHIKNFGSSTLGYVTPWNSKGYDIAKRFASKFTYISPVWYQIKIAFDSNKKFSVSIHGIHDVDTKWINGISVGRGQ